MENNGKLRVVAVSDLHGYEPKLPEGDILIVAGDCTARDEDYQWERFKEWLGGLDYKHKILIGGNHDNALQSGEVDDLPCHYLENSWIEIEGITFWGSPWTPSFFGQNPLAMAFTLPRMSMNWSNVPKCDVLITHGPPAGVCDLSRRGSVGDVNLLKAVVKKQPKFHVFGHIHECGGEDGFVGDTQCFNVSVLDRSYRLRPESIRVFEV